MAALNSLSATYGAALNADPKTALDKVLAEAKKNPLISSMVMTEDKTLAGQFTDGVRLTFGTTRIEGLPAAPPAPYASREDGRASAPKWLSKSTKAAVVNCLAEDTSMTTNAPQISSALASGGFSLVGGKPLKGSFDDFNSLRGLGFLYVESHGSVYKQVAVDRRLYTYYALVTDEEVTEASLARFAPLLQSEEMAISTISYRDARKKLLQKRVFSLTDNWLVKQPWFEDNAVAFLNTCNSGKATMREAISNTNLGVYMGWDRAVADFFATKTAKRLFALMAERDGSRQSWREAWEILGEEKLLVNTHPDIGGGETLKFAEGRTLADNLLPRIDSVTVDERTQVATLKGVFGQSKGHVLENSALGAPLTASSWTPDTITVPLKPTTHSLVAKVDSRLTNVFKLKVWTISSPSGGPFQVKNRVKIVLANRELTQFDTLINEPPGTPAGPKGPYHFTADPTKRFSLALYSDSATGSYGEISVTTPTGRRKTILPEYKEAKVWGADGLINVMQGFYYLDRF